MTDQPPASNGTPRTGETDFQRAAFRAVLIAIIAAAFVVPLALVAMPYIEFFNDMAVQPRGNPQGRYGRTEGLALPVARDPVPGTLPRDYEPYPYEDASRTTARKAGKELVNPVPAAMEHLKRGQRVYNVYCRTCHGEFGEGDGPVVGPDRYPAPPSLTSFTVTKYPDGQIYHIITRGQDRMPSYAGLIPPADRWKAIWFVRALEKTLPEKGEEAKE
jgi:mono/diheme cytochrome c family protein